AALDVLIGQHEHRHRTRCRLYDEMRHEVTAEEAGPRVNDVARRKTGADTGVAKNVLERVRVHRLPALPALRLRHDMLREIVTEGVGRPQGPHDESRYDCNQNAGSQCQAAPRGP